MQNQPYFQTQKDQKQKIKVIRKGGDSNSQQMQEEGRSSDRASKLQEKVKNQLAKQEQKPTRSSKDNVTTNKKIKVAAVYLTEDINYQGECQNSNYQGTNKYQKQPDQLEYPFKAQQNEISEGKGQIYSNYQNRINSLVLQTQNLTCRSVINKSNSSVNISTRNAQISTKHGRMNYQKSQKNLQVAQVQRQRKNYDGPIISKLQKNNLNIQFSELLENQDILIKKEQGCNQSFTDRKFNNYNQIQQTMENAKQQMTSKKGQKEQPKEIIQAKKPKESKKQDKDLATFLQKQNEFLKRKEEKIKLKQEESLKQCEQDYSFEPS